MLVERLLTSSFEERESALISRRYGVPGLYKLVDDRTKKDFVSPNVRIFVLNQNTARSILIGLCLHLLALGAKYKK